MYNNPFLYQSISRPSFLSRLLGRSSSVGLARSFNWGNIINGSSGYNCVTGTVVNSLGDVEVVSE